MGSWAALLFLSTLCLGVQIEPSQWTCIEGVPSASLAPSWESLSVEWRLGCEPQEPRGLQLFPSSPLLLSINQNGVQLTMEIPHALPLQIEILLDEPSSFEDLHRDLVDSLMLSHAHNTHESWECHEYMASYAPNLTVSACVAPSPRAQEVEARQVSDPPCCDQLVSSTGNVTSDCTCLGDYIVTSSENITVPQGTIIAQQILLRAPNGTVHFPDGPVALSAVGDITIEALEVNNAVETVQGVRLSSDTGGISITADSISLGPMMLSAMNISLTANGDTRAGIVGQGTTFVWSDQLTVNGTSLSADGVRLDSPQFNSSSGQMTLWGSSQNSSGLTLVQSVTQPPAASLIGFSGASNAIFLQNWVLTRAEVSSSCLPGGLCTGLTATGTLEIADSTVTAQGRGNENVTSGLNLDASTTTVLGTTELVALHPCTGMIIGPVEVKPGVSLSFNTYVVGNCTIATGIRVQSAIGVGTNATVTVNAVVAPEQSSQCYGLHIRHNITEKASALSRWVGEVIGSAPSGVGVYIDSGAFLGNHLVDGRASYFNVSRGIYLRNSVLRQVQATSYVAYSRANPQAAGIFADDTSFIDSCVLSAEGQSLCNCGVIEPVRAVWLSGTRVHNSTIIGSLYGYTYSAGAVDIDYAQLNSSRVEGYVEDGWNIVGVVIRNASLTESTIIGQSPTYVMVGNSFRVYGVAVSGHVNVSGTAILGAVLSTGTMVPIGINLYEATLVGTDLYLGGESPYSGFSSPLAMQNTSINLDLLEISSHGYLGPLLAATNITSTRLIFSTDSVLPSTLPRDVAFQVTDGLFSAISAVNEALTILSSFSNPLGSNLVFTAQSAGVYPLVVGNGVTESTLALGSGLVQFLVPTRVNGSLVVTGDASSSLHIDIWFASGNLTLAHNGSTRVFTSLLVAKQLIWAQSSVPGNVTCELDGEVQAADMTLCSHAQVHSNLRLVASNQVTLRELDCYPNELCDVTVEGSRVQCSRPVGNGFPVGKLQVHAPAGLYTTEVDMTVSVSQSALFNCSIDLVWNLGLYGDVNTALEIYGPITVPATMEIDRMANTTIHGSITNSTASGWLRVLSEESTFLAPVTVPTEASSRLMSNQEFNSVLAEGVLLLAPIPSNASQQESDLHIRRLSSLHPVTLISQGSIIAELEITSSEQYGRLRVDDLSSVGEEIHIRVAGSPTHGDIYRMISWNGTVKTTEPIFNCTSQTGSVVPIRESTLCQLQDDTSRTLIATFNESSLTTPMDNQLSFLVNTNPIAIHDTCQTLCQQTYCECCVNVLSNDTDVDGGLLSIVVPSVPVVDGQVEWTYSSNGTVCARTNNTLVPSSSAFYQAQDQHGALSMPARIDAFFVAATTPTPSASLSPSITLSSSPSPTTSSSLSSSPSLSTSASASRSSTPSPSASSSLSLSSTPTRSHTSTAIPSFSPNPTASASITSTTSTGVSETASPSYTPASSSTRSASSSLSVSSSNTPTSTGSKSPTSSGSRSLTASPSSSISMSTSASRTVSNSPTGTLSPPASRSATSSLSTSSTASGSCSHSPTSSAGMSLTSTPTLIATQSIGVTSSASVSLSRSQSSWPRTSDTASPSPFPSRSGTSSASRSVSPSASGSHSMTGTGTASITPSHTRTESSSISSSVTRSASARSPSLSRSTSRSATGSPSLSVSTAPTRIIASRSSSASITPSPSLSLSVSVSRSETASPSPSASGSLPASVSGTPLPSSSSSRTASPSASLSESASSSDIHSASPKPSLDPASMAGPVSVLATPLPSRSSLAMQGSTSTSARPTSSSSLPTSEMNVAQTLSGCQNCEYHNAEVLLSGDEEVVTLTTDDGRPVVTLNIPASLSGLSGQSQISIQFAQEQDASTLSGTSNVRSAVVDITLIVDGKVVTQLSEPLEICLTSLSSEPRSELCLSYYDVSRQEWRCEDLSLSLNAQGQWCGETNHLTSFALLLGGDIGSSGEYVPQSTIAWISLGLIIGAIIMVILAVGMIEIRQQIRRRNDTVLFRTMSTRLRDLSDA